MDHRSRKASASGMEAFASIVKLTRKFCSQFPDDDFAEICEELIHEACEVTALINRGRPASWAAGAVYTVAWLNLLHTKEANAGLDADSVASAFGVSAATVRSKSKILRETLELTPFDPSFTLSEMLDDNPFVWLLNVNGLMVDVRNASVEIQEAAYLEGLIPYVPAHDYDDAWESDGGRTPFLMDESSIVKNADGKSYEGQKPQRRRFSMWDVALSGPKWDFDLEPLDNRSCIQRFPRK